MTDAKIPREVGAAEMAEFLQISTRRLRELAKRGVLPKSKRGLYPMAECAAAYLAHRLVDVRTRAGGESSDCLRDQRREAIAARMRREDRSIVSRNEALEIFDRMAGQFLDSIAGLAARIDTDSPQDRRRVEAVCHAERDRLQREFARIRAEFVAGDVDLDSGDE